MRNEHGIIGALLLVVSVGILALVLAVCALGNGEAGANHSDACGNPGPNGGVVLVGTNHDDCLRGGNGNDEVYGKAGDDRLGGNHGSDLVVGGRGDDRIFGGRGPDILRGGPGRDVCGVDASDTVSGCEKLVDPGRN
jgi:Ca2+-binding RTX toxin-like protein